MNEHTEISNKVLTERRGRVLEVTINRPDVMNAIDPETSLSLRREFEAFRTDDELWVAILTGGGGRAFSTGNDLRAMSNAQASGKNTVSAAFSPTPFGGITRDFVCWKPIIAAVRGYCLAGGLEVALSCDFRIASDDSKFGMPEVSRGLVAGASGTQRLARIVGLPAALEILLTGKRVDAAWALAKNLVNEVVPGDQVLTRARQLADQISENGPIAVRLTKQAIISGLDLTLQEGIALERSLSAEALSTADSVEGPKAFVEKRKPQFQGR
jgi:enoyl-CoA hydratase/carnithine racemase